MDVSRDEYPHQSSRVLPVPGTPSRGAKRAHHARAFARIFSHPAHGQLGCTCDILSPPTRRGKLAPIGTTDRAEPRPFALTNRLTVLSSPPMNETGWRLRLHRQDRDRPHRARQAPHPDPGCQPQGAFPVTRKADGHPMVLNSRGSAPGAVLGPGAARKLHLAPTA